MIDISRSGYYVGDCRALLRELPGSRVGDIVLDTFFGSGTTGVAAEKHGRRWIGFDLNDGYEPMQRERTAQRSLVLGRQV